MSARRAAAPDHVTCGAKTRGGGACRLPAGHGTDHVGQGKCRRHGGATPIKHGRYSTIQRPRLQQLVAQFTAEADLLDTSAEVALLRALAVDYLERYDAVRDALVAWHASWGPRAGIVSEERREAFLRVLDAYEAAGDHGDALADEAAADLSLAREFVQALNAPPTTKPTQVADVADVARVVEMVSKAVERIERIRTANAVSVATVERLARAMGHVVKQHVRDAAVLAAIERAWGELQVA